MTLENVAVAIEKLHKQLMKANAEISHQQAHLAQAIEELTRVKQDKGRASPKEHQPKVSSPPNFSGKGSVTSWCTQVDKYLRDVSDKEALTKAMSYVSGVAHEWRIMYNPAPEAITLALGAPSASPWPHDLIPSARK